MGGLFGGKPQAPAPTPEAPKVNQEVVDRNARDIMRRRGGSAANVLTGGAGDPGSTSGSVAAKTLLGS